MLRLCFGSLRAAGLCIPLVLPCLAGTESRAASDYDEFRVKREAVFGFTRKPEVSLEGDRIVIRFETQGLCDVTVAVENGEGRIVRHLASGVLGPNAPEPFQRNSRRQVIVWDGKDDAGEYIDDKTGHTVRVSLGLKPQLERILYWHPKKRIGMGRTPLICPQPEGVYVYQGDGVEQVRLYDHGANYVRTVYPFPAGKIRQVKGLGWRTWPDGYEAPIHIGFWRSTFLTGGVGRTDAGPGDSARAFTVSNGRIAMLNHQLSRLATDGSTGGLDLYGPQVSVKPPWERRNRYRPKSAAISPDGKWLYYTGFYENTEFRAYGAYGANIYWIHGVYRMALDSNDTPALFLGRIERGRDDAHFFMPTSVTCDANGRIYVADHYNDRIQVFSSDGKLLKSLPVNGPAIVQLSPRTGEIYVFSWAMPWSRRFQKVAIKSVKPVLRRFKSLDDFRLVAAYPLPFERYRPTTGGGRGDEIQNRGAIDFWTDPPTIWLVRPVPPYTRWAMRERGIHLYVEAEGKLRLKHRFGDDVKKAGIRGRPGPLQRQRLYVDPRDGTLYVAEGDSGVSKAVTRLFKIDPDTGRGEEVELPFSMEDMAIDNHGRAYLRTTEMIGRFDLATWAEVPFDYGANLVTRFAYDCREAELIGGLLVPSNKPVYWHQSGMGVTPNGDLVVLCVNSKQPTRMRDGKKATPMTVKPFLPVLYPGRMRYGEVHVWDKHGKAKARDVIPGIPDGHGTYIDQKGDIYVLVAGTRLFNGTEKFAPLTGTLMKFTPHEGKFISDSARCPVPLGDTGRPEGQPVLTSYGKGTMWVRGAKWMYGGIGFVLPGGPCQCWNCRFHIDYFGRVFAPETQRGQVAVLDTNGNLILHIGRYGNPDDGVPMRDILPKGVRNPRRVPDTLTRPLAHHLGGDEVGLAYACYLATHTDRRLYIADAGNARILSVKLDYHTSERVALTDVRKSG